MAAFAWIRHRTRLIAESVATFATPDSAFRRYAVRVLFVCASLLFIFCCVSAACPGNQLQCGGVCTDLLSDAYNCGLRFPLSSFVVSLLCSIAGYCGNICAFGCQNGVCGKSPSAQRLPCHDFCWFLFSAACSSPSLTQCFGRCVDTTYDGNNWSYLRLPSCPYGCALSVAAVATSALVESV